MKIALALALIRLLSWLPLWLLYWVAVVPGWLLYLLPWRKHRVIRTNLALAFPELSPSARRRLHRRNLIEMVRLILESGAVWHWSADRLQAHIHGSEGFDDLFRAQQAGRGLLVISGHLGNWELGALLLSLKGPFSGLYKPPRDPVVDQALRHSRSRFGGRLIAAGSPAMRSLLRELKAGGTAGLLVDQLPRQGEGVFAPLFGRPALTMTLVNRLAQRTGCAVAFCVAERLPGGGGWRPRFSSVDPAIARDDAIAAASAMNQTLETAIRRAPAQYLWLYKRYAIQPDGQTDCYRVAD